MNLEKFAERNRKFLEKMRGLPDEKKKFVLWTIVGVLAIIMGTFWVKSATTRFSGIGEELSKIEFPVIDTSDMPTLPDLSVLENVTPSNNNLIK